LQDLVDAGTQVFWVDHHRTALERYRRGGVNVRFTDKVLSEAYAATRLTYEYLRTRLRRERRQNDWFDALRRLVSMADDNDRWIHQVPGSRELGLVVSLLGPVAYGELLNSDPEVTYTPRMREAQRQLQDELRRSFEVAERSRVVHRVPRHSLSVVTAVCHGYPSEVADAWGKSARNTVFALFDGRSLSVSLRRSPDCTVDLSVLAQRFGGGGHPAAAGCEMPELQRRIAEWLAESLVARIDR
jgi:oligoribonuclease NrnB/cAMP/cGMP phosphodiesterase (DHH superfamily)